VIETRLSRPGLGRTRPPFASAATTSCGRYAAACRVIATVAVVTTLLFAPSPDGASGAEQVDIESSPIRLRAVTTITGSQPGSTRVFLPKDVDLNGRYEGGVDEQLPYDFRGNGRMTAVLLTEVGEEHPTGEGASLLAWTYGRCLERGCRARGSLVNNVVGFGALEERDDKTFLPRGNYELFFVADGTWAKFRMELAGLSGKVRIRPRGPLTSEVRSLRPKSSAQGGEGLYWDGRATTLEGEGLAVLGLWLDGAEAIKGEGGFCTYDAEPAEPETAYMPPCPTADYQQTFQIEARSAEFSYYTKDLAIDRGMGVWYGTASELERAGGTALWIAL
jgi:hypothetical protein